MLFDLLLLAPPESIPMKKSIFFFLLLLPLFAFNSVHKFYVSVTEMEYNEKSKSLQVISRVFIDDMENLLKTRYNEELYLTKDEEHPAAEEFLQKYLSAKLKVTVNGKEKGFSYVGKQYDNDQLILYIEIEEVAPLELVEVQNEVLTDLFPDQKNVVHVTYKGKTKSLLLSRHQESGRLNFR